MAWAKWLFPVPGGPRKSASSRCARKRPVASSWIRARFIFLLKSKSKLSYVELHITSILCSAALCEARLTSGGARPRAFALLHITSQRFQPGEQVGFSPGWWRTVEIRRLTRLQGCAFHLEVDFDVRVCCFDAGVA